MTSFRLRNHLFVISVAALFSGGVSTAAAQGVADGRSLYERLGGLPAISLVVSDFVDEFIRDSVIIANPRVREQKTPQAAPYVKFQVTTLVCELAGGPCNYTGKNMREAHAGLNVSAQEWDRMVAIFSATLDRHQVPQREREDLFALLGPTRADIVTR